MSIELCAACGCATPTPAAAAIARIGVRDVHYFLCAGCAVKARAEPDRIAEAVEAKLRAAEKLQ